jgi:ABC-type transporter Mla maintaining outer membrane lipid asymmetry permease subunit MlaE
VSSVFEPVAKLVVGFFEWFGSLGIFSWQVMRAAVTPPFEWRELIRQMDEVGSKSLPLVAMAGGAIGAVLSMEARSSLSRFGAKSMQPSVIVYTVVLEMGPIITALVVSGRVGAGIGAELASMKVTEQIDAIEASAINPYRLLAATRIMACIGCVRRVHGLGDADSGCPGFAAPVYQQRLQRRYVQQLCSADIQDRRVRPHCRADCLFSGNADARRRRGRGPRSNKFSRPVFSFCYFGRCGAGEIHPGIFPLIGD